MCPDNELLSAFYDDELDSAWGGRIAEHVSGCSVCKARLARFSQLSNELQRLKEPDFAASMTRSWKAIADARPAKPVSLWNRRISVPVPLLAAAAAVVVAVLGVAIYFNLSVGQQRVAAPIALQQAEITPVDFQVNNLNDILNYLNSKDFATSITIQLPKGVNQLAVGKPQLIRAADYNRGQ